MDVMDTNRQKLLMTLQQLLAIQATTVKPALDEASTLIADAIGADKVDTFLHDPAKQTLVAVGTSKTPMGRQQQALGLDRLPIANGGRAGEVFQTGQIYLHGQVDTDLEELRGIREALGVKSEIVVPLEINGVRRGVVQADSMQRDAFSVEDMHFLQAVAHWIGMVIQRAELIERLTRDAAEQARQLVAEELVTVLAHDLGNYLTPLVGRAYILRSRAEREGRTIDAQEIGVLQQGLKRLERLIADLLDVGRIEQGVFALVHQPTNLAELAKETAAALQTSEFSVEVQAPDELVAEADPDRVRQALENLLLNARRHAPGSPIVLEVRREQRAEREYAILSVQDRGPGIPPAVLPRLTQRFVRGKQSKGLGIGLYLTRSIADAHGGTLEVDTVLDEGTTFRLVVPITAK